jgi:hypothetical protein
VNTKLDRHVHPTIEVDGWTLLSAEEHQARHPTFELPDRSQRESLKPGDSAKLLFDIETRKGGEVLDRGVDRMWVIVKKRLDRGYLGVLDSDPGLAENLNLRPGFDVVFTAENIIAIDHPPEDYILEKYGRDFFHE